MTRNNQHFGELEYCFSQYFSKYCAPVIAKDYRYYHRKQSEEYDRALQNHANAFTPISAQMHAAQNDARSTEWGKKTIDDFIKAVSGKIASNKQFAKDWYRLTDEYRIALINKLGDKGYYNAAVALKNKLGEKTLVDPAEYYGQMRFVQLLKEQLARTDMPKSSLEYVLKEAVSNNSLLGMVVLRIGRSRGLSNTEEELKKLGKKFYRPSSKEKAAAWVTGAAIDVAGTAGTGNLASAGKTLVTNTIFNAAGTHIEKGTKYAMGWLGLNDTTTGHVSQKEYSKIIFGNENTLGKYQRGTLGYRKTGTEYISNVNDGLGKKIKVAPIRPHVSDSVTHKDSCQLLTAANGNSRKLLKTITTALSRQALPYDSHASIPAWMLNKTAKQCRAFATSFFSIAKQMSTQGLPVWNLNGRNMTLIQVSQRAGDYARAAVQIDKINAEKQAARMAVYNRNHPQTRQERKSNEVTKAYTAVSQSASQPIVSSAVSPSEPLNTQHYQDMAMGTQQIKNPMSETSPYSNMLQTSGWGKYLDNSGLNGFSDVTKNLGYVFAMLPDMLIGMFTGKSSSFTIGNNILPLAAVAAGMFSHNPLLKLMLMGFGGVNLLNNAGHEALGLSTPKATPRNYKQYADEPLNPRLNNVFMRGRSLIADIDNRPVVINISDTVVDAYEKKAIPLNTLANAVLRKYDENRSVASNTYDKSLAALESQEQQRSYGLK